MLCSFESCFSGHTTWDSVASQFTWPHLEELTLGYFAISEQFLIEFLTRHAKTLQLTHFENTYLIPSENSLPDHGAWPRFFAMFKSRVGQFPNLKDMTFGQFLFFKHEGCTRPCWIALNKIEDHEDCWWDSLYGHDVLHEVPETGFGDTITQFLFNDGVNPFQQRHYAHLLESSVRRMKAYGYGKD